MYVAIGMIFLRLMIHAEYCRSQPIATYLGNVISYYSLSLSFFLFALTELLLGIVLNELLVVCQPRSRITRDTRQTKKGRKNKYQPGGYLRSTHELSYLKKEKLKITKFDFAGFALKANHIAQEKFYWWPGSVCSQQTNKQTTGRKI